eukprot:scaffold59921_cov37-Tisochrysis_lutea.AAC.1
MIAIVGDWRDSSNPNFGFIGVCRADRLAELAGQVFVMKAFAALRVAVTMAREERQGQAASDDKDEPGRQRSREKAMSKGKTPDHLRKQLDRSQKRSWWMVQLQHSWHKSQLAELLVPGSAKVAVDQRLNAISRPRAVKLIRQAQSKREMDSEDYIHCIAPPPGTTMGC